MKLHKDFSELLALFHAHGVEYVVVGGYALAYHGAPRYTGDLDLFINRRPDNACRILSALRDFGFGSMNLTVEDFTKPDNVVQLGVPPVRVDLITSIDGVTWEEAWKGRGHEQMEGARISFIGRAEFMANKRASGRRKDLADLEALGEES